MKDVLELFEADEETEGIVLIGEIGGQMEIEAARWAKENVSKPGWIHRWTNCLQEDEWDMPVVFLVEMILQKQK